MTVGELREKLAGAKNSSKVIMEIPMRQGSAFLEMAGVVIGSPASVYVDKPNPKQVVYLFSEIATFGPEKRK